jgi:Mycotoxin biosynthesis protein UstYa
MSIPIILSWNGNGTKLNLLNATRPRSSLCLRKLHRLAHFRGTRETMKKICLDSGSSSTRLSQMRSCLQDTLLAVLIVALSIASICLTQTLFVFTTQIQFETKVTEKEHSQPFQPCLSTSIKLCSRAFPPTPPPILHVPNSSSTGMLGDDWPPFYPLELERKIEMVVEESVHYHDASIGARDEWRYQRGFGFDGAARLGDENRTFAVSLYHQTHCLLNLHAAQLAISSSSSSSSQSVDKDDRRRPRYAHLQHCLNYLRLQALCHPDLTLEPGDFAKRDFGVEREGETYVCRDFETAWDRNTLRWLEWHRFLNEKLDAA